MARNQLQRIADGWLKALGVAKVDQATIDLANERIQVCLICPESTESWLSKFVGDELQKDVLGSGMACGKCDCPLQAKAVVPDERCPLGKWKR